jgi:two-component SAPR family response regulator
MEMSGRELMGLYLFLQAREEELDHSLYSLYNRLQRRLCEELSIDEMERIEKLYKENVDVFKK